MDKTFFREKCNKYAVKTPFISALVSRAGLILLAASGLKNCMLSSKADSSKQVHSSLSWTTNIFRRVI